LKSCPPVIRPFVTLSAHAPNETDESHRKRIRAFPSARHVVETSRPRLWWSQTGSNRRPHACKARALPTELWPRFKTRRRPKAVVGLGGLEPPTSRLSSARSNQLSYKPGRRRSPRPRRHKGKPRRKLPYPRSERETKAARSRKCSLTGCLILSRMTNLGRGKPRSLVDVSESRKEVIQPQVPLRLPCYDFTPVADPTVAGCLLAVSAPSSGKTNSHGVTGGVYKARERIHRGVLIRDY
jgi:hypothetical protein